MSSATEGGRSLGLVSCTALVVGNMVGSGFFVAPAAPAPYMPIGIVAFVFSMGTIYGAGAHAGMWALILILLAAPVWVFLVAEDGSHAEEKQS